MFLLTDTSATLYSSYFKVNIPVVFKAGPDLPDAYKKLMHSKIKGTDTFA